MRIAPFGMFITIALLLGVLLLEAGMRHSRSDNSNAPLPVISITGLDGKTVWEQESLQGHVTIINFFASWCAPCAEEMPALAKLKKQYPKVQFVGVAWNDREPTIRKWLAKNGDPFDSHWLDQTGDATMALGIKGIPESFVVDKNGNLRYRLSGMLTPDVEDEVHTQLDQLLNEPTVAK